jgi:imidazole glycerol-phosphate synthase subunit HisF
MSAEKIRIIPKLEIKNQYLIKGVRFEGLRKIGDPVEFAQKYYKEGADQINIIDIVASLYGRDNLYETVNKITDKVFVPICVGGGIKNLDHIKKLLKCGADRIIINSEALRNKDFLNQVIKTFGSQFITISIEAKKIDNEYYCMMDHGRENSNKRIKDWLSELSKYELGEIIVSSIDQDGMQNGFDNDLALILDKEKKITCPKVISGGAGKNEDFCNILKNKNLQGLSASTCLHFNKVKIPDLKNSLRLNKININNL